MTRNLVSPPSVPTEIEAMLGARLEQIRLSRNVSQRDVAAEAGISLRTMTRLEKGQGVSLDTLIRVLIALGLADRLETLLPDPAIRPMERARNKGRERQRARKKAPSGSAATPWRWGESAKE
ncbi:MAG: helix-turn-helix domain-containing protein [Parvularculaceae bacterium]|nr:helix-turn-helix domain-containing protein [Parvularculaceae bacterium]